MWTSVAAPVNYKTHNALLSLWASKRTFHTIIPRVMSAREAASLLSNLLNKRNDQFKESTTSPVFKTHIVCFAVCVGSDVATATAPFLTLNTGQSGEKRKWHCDDETVGGKN